MHHFLSINEVICCNRTVTCLHYLVPARANNYRVDGIWAETDTADPFAVTLILNVELAFTKGVPKLDGAVTATTDDLSVVGREGDGKDIGGVPDKAASGGTCV